jgi:hypothetical protein
VAVSKTHGSGALPTSFVPFKNNPTATFNQPKVQWLEFPVPSKQISLLVNQQMWLAISLHAEPTQVKKGGWVSVNPRILFIYNGYHFCCRLASLPSANLLHS